MRRLGITVVENWNIRLYKDSHDISEAGCRRQNYASLVCATAELVDQKGGLQLLWYGHVRLT